MNPIDYIIIPLALLIWIFLFEIPHFILIDFIGLPEYSLTIFLLIFFGWSIFYCVRFFAGVTRQLLNKRRRKTANPLYLKHR